MKDSWIIAVVVLVALCFMALMLAPHFERAVSGANDFVALYAGARLLGTGNLYDSGRLHEASRQAIGRHSPDHGYIRLPFHAVFLWPLSRLPYRQAYLLWELAGLAAFVGFMALWRPPKFALTLLFSCLSLPAFSALLNGQDTTFLLLFLALAASLHKRSMPFAAGLVFSLCGIKFHFFLLIPLLIVGQRSWRFGKGLVVGAALLLAVSFAGAGWGWPLDFYHAVSNPGFSPGLEFMPNLHGALAVVPGGTVLEMLLGASVAAAVWMVCRYRGFLEALAACLAGGMLLSYHAYLPDFSLLLPAALTVMATSELPALRALAVVLLAPPTHLAIVFGFPYAAAAVAVNLLFVYLMAYQAWRLRSSVPRAAAEVTAPSPSEHVIETAPG